MVSSARHDGFSIKRIISLALYNTGVVSYNMLLHIAQLFNTKAAKWVSGRKNWRENLAQKQLGEQQPIWIHAASLGEFEQARPIISAFRDNFPTVPILVTFFSPSGFEQVRNKGLADYIFYLPIDHSGNAKYFVDQVNPRLAVFVKYEFWYYFYRELAHRNIPLYIVSAIFRAGQPFFRPYGYLFRELLFFTDHIFVQDLQSQNLLDEIGVQQATVTGDTRFDRVVEIAASRKNLPEVHQFLEAKKTIVAGSTWPNDEKMLASSFLQQTDDLKLIVAPHEVDNEHIEEIEKLFGSTSIRYSALPAEEELTQYKVLIIDNIGMLASLYQYGTFAYVGGGFDAGIHNTLEAAVYGMPVFFGPNYHKFKEAKRLIETGGAFSVKSSEAFATKLQWLLEHDAERERAAEAAYHYVQSQTGSTSTIMEHLRQYARQ